MDPLLRAARGAQGGGRGRSCPGSARSVNLPRWSFDLARGDARKPVRHRRGPATVTGSTTPLTTPLGNREGERRPEARRPLRSRHQSRPPGGGMGGPISVHRLFALRHRPGARRVRASRRREPAAPSVVVDDAGDSVAVRTPGQARRLADPRHDRAALRDRRRATRWSAAPSGATIRPTARAGPGPRRRASIPISRRCSRSSPISSCSTTRRSTPRSPPGSGSSASRRSGSTPTPSATSPGVGRLLGRLTGHERGADSMSAVFDTALASATAAGVRPRRRPKVLILAWEQPPMTIGRGSFLSELVERAGWRQPLRRHRQLIGAGQHRGGERAGSRHHPHHRGRSRQLRRPARVAGGARRAGAAVPARSRAREYDRPGTAIAAAIRGARRAAPRGARDESGADRGLLLVAGRPARWPLGLAAGTVPLSLGEVWARALERGRARLGDRPRAAGAAGAARVPGRRQPGGLRRRAPGDDPESRSPSRTCSGSRAAPAWARWWPSRPASAGPWAVPVAAFVGALAAVGLVYRLSLVAGRRLDPRVLLLSGVVVGAFAGALMSAIIVLSDAPTVRNAFLWLLGGFGAASWQALAVFAAYAALPLAADRPERPLARPHRPGRGAGPPPRRRRRAHPAAGLPLHGAADRRQRRGLRHHRVRRAGRAPRRAHLRAAASTAPCCPWCSPAAARFWCSRMWSPAPSCGRSSCRSGSSRRWSACRSSPCCSGRSVA